jgi:hypothetical protein
MLDRTIPPWITRICKDACVTQGTFKKTYTMERVRSYMEAHLGAHNKDVAHALKLSTRTVSHYVRLLRLEWKK